MADIISFKQKRKAKARDDKDKKAAENRAKFGRTKEEKLIEKQKTDKANRHLDGHKLDSNKPENN